MIETLLSTKLNIPPVPSRAVRRERLIERLNETAESKLTLISAPAGFGKTTLVSMWAEQAGMPVAWLSLGQEDNDLARFLAYLIAALQRADPEIGKDALGTLQTPQRLSHEIVMTSLLNDLAESEQAMGLVFDDYHMIQVKTIHQAVIYLLDHLPTQMHLTIATRADPPLLLPRLRARGHLIELRQSDLRFTAAEAAAFLNNTMGLGLSSEQISALEARTEGWIAGLQMAALSLHGRGADTSNRSAFIQAFTGSHRYVLDYLVEEVLEQQTPELQEFLLRTSILERLCGPLCDEIAGFNGDSTATRSQAILEELEAANLFIVPLDDERRWYRYHRLFSDLLYKRLSQTSPDLIPELHQRASSWYQQNEMMTLAIEHALAGYDHELAVRLIDTNMEATLMRSEVTTFLNWMEKLPDEWVRSRPTMGFYHAWAMLMSGRSLDEVDKRLREIAYDLDGTGHSDLVAGRLAAMRAYMTLFTGDMKRTAELCHQALENLPESDLFLRGIVVWILSLARFAVGDMRKGTRELENVIKVSQEMGNPLIAVTAICHQARLQMRQGRAYQAKETFERALQFATDPKGRRLPIASEALIGLGELLREWNDLELAVEYLTESIELAKQWSELASFDAYFPLARVRLAQGDVEAAREAIETARQIAQRSEATEVDDLLAEMQRADFCISQGDLDGAMGWAETRALSPDHSPKSLPGLDEDQDIITTHLRKYEHLLLARIFIMQDRAGEALDLLNPLLAQAKQLGRIDLIIQVQILRARAFQVLGDDREAIEVLSESLALAEPGGYMRIYLEKGEPMLRLLRACLSRGISPSYVAKLLEGFDKPESAERAGEPPSTLTQRLLEPLSEREMGVLRLLARGMSNPEIADELVIATSTVHSHCKSIYSKLDVHKRWDAVERAKELGVI